MFAFNRSPFAVLLPLALLIAVATWSNRTRDVAAPQGARDQTVAANLPSR